MPPVLGSRFPNVVEGRPRAARADEDDRALVDRRAPAPPPPEEKEPAEDVRDIPVVDIVAAAGSGAEIGVRVSAGYYYRCDVPFFCFAAREFSTTYVATPDLRT